MLPIAIRPNSEPKSFQRKSMGTMHSQVDKSEGAHLFWWITDFLEEPPRFSCHAGGHDSRSRLESAIYCELRSCHEKGRFTVAMDRPRPPSGPPGSFNEARLEEIRPRLTSKYVTGGERGNVIPSRSGDAGNAPD